jgi:hypothetical protein
LTALQAAQLGDLAGRPVLLRLLQAFLMSVLTETFGDVHGDNLFVVRLRMMS